MLDVLDQSCVCFLAAWALVGDGANVLPRSEYSINAPKVIVSRSHAGKVKGFIEDAFGNNTVIIPAGGAGTAYFNPLESARNSNWLGFKSQFLYPFIIQTS